MEASSGSQKVVPMPHTIVKSNFFYIIEELFFSKNHLLMTNHSQLKETDKNYFKLSLKQKSTLKVSK